jgi:calcium channel MID1
MTKSPTPSQTANIGAQTYIVNTPSAALDAFLDTSHPVLVVDFDYNVTSLSVIINLVADEGVDAPSTYVSADPESAGEEPPEPNYYPGNTRVAPDSGGTSYGGYNRRKGGTWQVVYDRGFANWTYGYTLAAGPVANPAPVRPSILIGLGIDADITYNPELVNDVPVRVVILIDTECECQRLSSALLITTVTEGSAALSPAYPYVGDSTSSEAILFSPVLYHSKLPQPSYPNYTFPSAELDMAVWDELEQTTGDSNFVFGSNSSISLIALPTDKSTYPLGLANSAYALLYLLDTLNETSKIIVDGAIGQATNWTTIGGDQGYRYWEVYTGLEPNTSYVVWTLSTPSSGSWNLVLTQPVFFTTKSSRFPFLFLSFCVTG